VVFWIDPARHPDAAAGSQTWVDEAAAGSSDPRMLVVRAVEILRGHLLPVAAAPHPLHEAGAAPPRPVDASSAASAPAAPPAAPTPAEAGAPADADAPKPPHPRAVLPDGRGPSFFLGPAVLASLPGGVGATPQVWTGARWAPVTRIDLELLAFAPTIPARVSAPEGSSTLRAGALGAGGGLRLLDPASSVFATAGAGLGAMLIAFDGQAQPPWKSAGGVRVTMLPYTHFGAGYWLVPRFALRADVMIGFALPEPVLWIAGHRVAVFGEPAAIFAASVEVRP
jgi:hypothetical protein